jgi:hypothetical protein
VSQGPVVIPGAVIPGVVIPGMVMVPGVVVVVLGPGTVTNGLTPPLFNSVAPSGIVPPLRVDEMLPGFDSGEAVPLDDPADVVQLDVAPIVPMYPVIPIDPVELVGPAIADPPPSNVEPMPVADDMPVIPANPEDPAPASPEVPVPATPQLSPGVVLNPPGLISVAPSGRPVGELPVDVLAPIVPRGDVIPSAGGVVVATPGMPVMVCANAAPQLSTSPAAIIDNPRIRDLLSGRLTSRIRMPRHGTTKLAFR